ncbi:MAG: hypothetical protein HOO86_14205 [Bacteroidales bacterium]|nr:hypothetical protein [Bacteroidales bacterium]
MKKINTLIIAVLLSLCIFAQAPDMMSYQAVIRDAANTLVMSTAVGIQVSVLQGSSSGTEVYKETHATATNANGLISLSIGAGNPVLGDFSAIDWSVGPYFLKTETDITGGSNYTITTVNELLSVPFAQFANSVASYPETDPVFEAYQPTFWQYYGLNSTSSTVGNTWTNLYPTNPFTITKSLDKTDIEITVLSNFGGGTFDGASGVRFQALVDGLPYDFGNKASIINDNSLKFLSLFSVTRNLNAGSHTISIWAKTYTGTASNVIVDPGGWGGTIIIKEVR